MIRLLSVVILVIALPACDQPRVITKVERIEVRTTNAGYSLSENGTGRCLDAAMMSADRSQSFTIDAGQFRELVNNLKPYQARAEPTDAASKRFMSSSCPAGVPSITDAGMVSIRWLGARDDNIYLVDLGCDPKKFARRNDDLRSIIDRFPKLSDDAQPRSSKLACRKSMTLP